MTEPPKTPRLSNISRKQTKQCNSHGTTRPPQSDDDQSTVTEYYEGHSDDEIPEGVVNRISWDQFLRFADNVPSKRKKNRKPRAQLSTKRKTISSGTKPLQLPNPPTVGTSLKQDKEKEETPEPIVPKHDDDTSNKRPRRQRASPEDWLVPPYGY